MHMEGEEIAYTHMGYIPAFSPLFVHNVTIKEPREDLEKEFSYLKVEYISIVSPVHITFQPNTSLITFRIKLPFLNIPFGIAGYALNVLQTKIWNEWNETTTTEWNETTTTTLSSLDDLA